MATVFVRGSKEPAIVDDVDLELVAQYEWRYKRDYTGVTYARTSVREENGYYRTIYMHRLIVRGVWSKIDHINGNGLDNRRVNLRDGSFGRNERNQKARINGVSQYKGVTWTVKSSRWRSRVVFEGETIHLGYFDLEEEAALAYNVAASHYFGEYVKLNVIEPRLPVL